MMVEPMQSNDHQIPREILEEAERRRAARERALRELKAMTADERLEACRSFVNATLERGDNLIVAFYPPWINEGKSLRGQSEGYKATSIPEPALAYHDFTRDELVAILKPMGKVDDWRDKVPQPIVALISSWKNEPRAEEESYGPIVAKRLHKARLALEMDIKTFYAPATMLKRTALKWEAGAIPAQFICYGERRFKALSEAHSIPMEWLICLDRLLAVDERRQAERQKADRNERRLIDCAALEAQAKPGTEVKCAVPDSKREVVAWAVKAGEISVLYEVIEDGKVVNSGGFGNAYLHSLNPTKVAS